MHKSDLVETLGVFTLEEQKRLKDLFNSPYGNPHWPAPHALRLVEAVFEAMNRHQPDHLQKQLLYEAVFPNETPVFNKLEKQASLALKITRRFIQLESLNKMRNEAFDQYLLGLFYLEKSMPEAYEDAHEKLKTWQEDRGKWGHWEYTVNWLIEENYKTFKSEFYKKNDDQNLMNSIRALEDLYLNERNFYTCLLFNINQVTPITAADEKAGLLKSLDDLKDAAFASTPIGTLYRQAIALVSTPITDPETVNAFMQMLYEQESDLNTLYFNHFEVFAINCCVRNNSINPGFLSLIYELLKKRANSGRIYHRGKITAGEYQNIVKLGLSSGDFEWVRAFLEGNRDNITGSLNPEELYRFNLANYWFHIKDYDQALDVLLKSDYKDSQYKLIAKLLEIKILYEIQSEILPSKIDAAKIFFYRENSIPATRKAQYNGFVDFMRRLIRPETAVNPERIRKLKEELLSAPPIAEWYWAQQKLDELLEGA